MTTVQALQAPPTPPDRAVLSLAADTPLLEEAAVLILGHLLAGGEVEVRLSTPDRGGPLPAPTGVRRERLADAVNARLEELAWVAGEHAARVTVVLLPRAGLFAGRPQRLTLPALSTLSGERS